MYEADGFQAASPYLGDRDKTWKSLDLCQRTWPKKRKEKKKKKQKIAKLRDPSIYIPLLIPIPIPFPCALLALKCQIRNNIEAIAQRSSILWHIYDIMPYIFAYMDRKTPTPPP